VRCLPCINGPLDGDGILLDHEPAILTVVRCGIRAKPDEVGREDISVVQAAPPTGAPVVHRYLACDLGHLHYDGVE
jgi:hypothetical protein